MDRRSGASGVVYWDRVGQSTHIIDARCRRRCGRDWSMNWALSLQLSSIARSRHGRRARRPILFYLCKKLVRRAALETLFARAEGGMSVELAALAELIDAHIEMEASPMVRGLPRDWPGLAYRRMLRHAEKVEAALLAWVRKEAGAARADNLMCVLANSADQNGDYAGETAILNNLPTLFGAAYETTQTALAWALSCWRNIPRPAAALVEEVGSSPDDAPERLLQRPWLDAIVRESMRLLPSVPTQTRRTSCNAARWPGEGRRLCRAERLLTNREPELYLNPTASSRSAGRISTPARLNISHSAQAPAPASAPGSPPTCCASRSDGSPALSVAIAPGAAIHHRVRLTLRPGRNGIPVSIHTQDRRFKASAVGGNICRIVRFDA